MKRSLISVLVLSFGLLLAAVQTLAHHSFAGKYDLKNPVDFTGTVTKVEWMNPHIHIYVEVNEPNGKVCNYSIEANSPIALSKLGWTKDSLKSGDRVMVAGLRARDGSNQMFPQIDQVARWPYGVNGIIR